MPSVVLAASHAALAYGLDHHRFMAAFLRMLLSFWPLLLVAAGTVLLLDVFTDKVKALPGPKQNFQEKYFQGQSSGMSISLPFVRRVNERLGSGGS
jgi:hypothetical protein